MKFLNVFVADDNPGDVGILREMLKEHNVAHRLHVENDGEAAIQYITGYDGQTPCPDLFVIDVRMPKVSGLDVVKTIREKPCFSALPIVLMSNALSGREERDIETIPLCFFLPKPNSLDAWFQIGDFIRTLCGKDQTRPSDKARSSER